MKVQNKILGLIAVFAISMLALTGLASATYDYTTNCYDSNGNQLASVRAMTFVCSDATCTTLGALIDNQSVNSNTVVIRYPVNGTRYATYWFSPGYIYKEMTWVPVTDGGSYTDNLAFNKKANAQAVINSFVAPDSIEAGNLVTLTSNVQSALSEVNAAPYAEPSYADLVRDYYSMLTKVNLTITNSTGRVVYSNVSQDYILWDSAKGFNYAWTPSAIGMYTATLTTDVIDSKAEVSSRIQSSQTKPINVTVVPDLSMPTSRGSGEGFSSPATYAPGRNYTFSADWGDNVGVTNIIMNFNGTNYSVAPSYVVNGGDSYYTGVFSITDLTPGIYIYRWYASDFAGNVGQIGPYTYVVTQATPSLSISVLPANSVANGTSTNVSGLGCPSQLNCTLYRSGVAVANPDIANLSAGTYVYVFNTTGNSNYTFASSTNVLRVGSSGSSSSSSSSSSSGTIKELTEAQFSNGYTLSLRENDRVKFIFCGAPYYLKLTEIDEDRARFSLTPGGVVFSLEESDSEQFDLDNDKVYDLKVRVASLGETTAKVYLKRLTTTCTSARGSQLSNIVYEDSETLGTKKKEVGFWGSALFLVIVLFAIFVLLLVIFAIVLRKAAAPKKKVILKQN